MTDANDWNTRIIEEFRANGGKVGGQFAGAPIILVHHLGRRSGVERVNPLVYLPVEGGYAVFASKAGAPTHPDWYRNLVAHPATTVEVGDQTTPVVAREATGDERQRIFARQKELMPGFAEYETSAAPRLIPVVVLEPAT
ncbi:MAG: nitroreductase family deazaflavin-dependent oxidoreductase [Actinomycetes bacterium]